MARLKMDDFKNYSFIGDLKISPDGESTGVIVKKANDQNGYDSAIYIDKGDGYSLLTNEKGGVISFLWLDQDHILFSDHLKNKADLAKNKIIGITKYYRINIHGGEALFDFSVDLNVSSIHLLAEDEYLLWAGTDMNTPSLEAMSEQDMADVLKEFEGKQNYQIIDELPYWSNGAGFINKKRKRLFRFHKERGLMPLTPEDAWVNKFKLSPCKKHLAFTGGLFSAGIREPKQMLYDLNLSTLVIEPLVDEAMIYSAFDFWHDQMVIGMSLGETYSFQEHPTFYTLDLKTKSLKKLSEFDRSIGSTVGTDCAMSGGYIDMVRGDNYYFISLNGYYSDIFKLCLKSGKIENITNARGSIEFFDMSYNFLKAVAFLNGRLQEVYHFLPTDAIIKESTFNDEIYDATDHPQIKHFILTDQEGVKFDGFAYLPVDYDEKKKYPAILNIHGGPKGAYGDIYFHEMQYWANENYFVFFANPRGSDGKGNQFAFLRGLYGTIDYDNLMQFMDEMLKTFPAVDKDRLGVTGGSYGGYMTNWIIGHTHRFKAAATQRSISNWFSYMIGDLGYFFTDFDVLANPFHDPEKLWDNSPLKYINQAKTPTLIIHSMEDYRCCVSEAFQLFTALKLHGVPTRMCIFHNENHELSRKGKPENRLKRLTEITHWMDQYLKN